MASAFRKTKDAVKKKFGKERGKNADDKSQQEREKEGQRLSSSIAANKKDVGTKEFESLPDVVSTGNAPNGKAPVSKPSVSGQGSSGSLKESDMKSAQGNLNSELSDPNVLGVPHQECPKSSMAEDHVATTAAEAYRSNDHGSTIPVPCRDNDLTSINIEEPSNAKSVSSIPISSAVNSSLELNLSGDVGQPQNPNSEASVVGATGSQSLHNQEQNLSPPAHVGEVVPPNPISEASRDQDSVSGHELHHNQEIDAATSGRIAEALNCNHGTTAPATSSTSASASATTTPTTTSTSTTTTTTAATAVTPEETTRVVGSNSVAHNRQEAIVPTATVPPFQSLTGTPVQEEAESTVEEGTTVDETTQQEETATSYDHLFVSDVIRKNKLLEDKLAGELDRTSHHVIKNWEHLSCTREVNAPLETRLRCKLNSENSCTQMLIDLLVAEKGDKTVQDLIAALKAEAVGRHDVVKIITDVYPDAENSTETISDFAGSDANSELLKKMCTKLDQKSRIIGYWKNLGQQFKISGEKLKEIECGQFNPTLALMEYLYSKQTDLTVKKIYDEVENNLKRGDVLKKLKPYLAEHSEKLMKDVISLESDTMRGICVCLNNPNRVLKNWRNLASAFKVPRDIYKDFNPVEPKRSTILLLEWIYANKTDLTVGQLCSALQSIDRNDVVRDIRTTLNNTPVGTDSDQN